MPLSTKVRRVVGVGVVLLLLAPVATAKALTDEHMRRFSPNDIMFYDPDECGSGSSSSATAVGGTAKVSGSSAEEKLWSGLKSMGLSDEATAGILGNMMSESGFNPARFESSFSSSWKAGLDSNGASKSDGFNWKTDNGESRGLGLVQWSFDLRIAAWKYVEDHDKDLADNFLGHPEIYGGLGGDEFIKTAKEQGRSDNEINALYSLELTHLIEDNLKGGGSGENTILSQNTPEAAALSFATNFEKCAACGDAESDTMKHRVNKANELYAKYKGKTSFGGGTSDASGSVSSASSSVDSCCNPDAMPASDGIYPGAKYALSDDQIRRIAAMANNENGGSVAGIKSEVSLMANLFEKNKGPAGDVNGLVSYLLYGRWFAGSSIEAYNSGGSYANQEYIDATKDVLVNGNRTLPAQIVEHDCFTSECGAGIASASNDGGKTWFSINSKTDKEQFKRGVTIFQQGGGLSGRWIFWDWADPEKKSGDPFGYLEDSPPNTSDLQGSKGTSATKVSGSGVTWDNGWISAGMNGYVRDEINRSNNPQLDSTFGKDFTTDALNGSGKGPNKITLHVVEGPGINANSVRYVYSGSGTPPHFTIDIKNKKVYQHGSILKASSAIARSDLSAGVQIEIFGYDNTAELPSSYKDWYLDSDENFSDEDWLYLAELLNAISVETGIPLSTSVDWSTTNPPRLSESDYASYEGILGHKHTPPPNDHSDPEAPGIWTRIEKALANFTGAQQGTECATGGAIGEEGLTYEQAKQFAIWYGTNKNNSSLNALGEWYWAGDSPGSLDYLGSNCCAFSAFFLNKFTKTPTADGNGWQVVSNLAAERGTPTGTEPRVWSVFSWGNGALGHTGVVLGHHNGEWIVGHASYHYGGHGPGDGMTVEAGSAFVFKNADINQAVWGGGGTSGLIFAYLDDQTDTAAISRYISTGE